MKWSKSVVGCRCAQEYRMDMLCIATMQHGSDLNDRHRNRHLIVMLNVFHVCSVYFKLFRRFQSSFNDQCLNIQLISMQKANSNQSNTIFVYFILNDLFALILVPGVRIVCMSVCFC